MLGLSELTRWSASLRQKCPSLKGLSPVHCRAIFTRNPGLTPILADATAPVTHSSVKPGTST